MARFNHRVLSYHIFSLETHRQHDSDNIVPRLYAQKSFNFVEHQNPPTKQAIIQLILVDFTSLMS
jgi:hypothetical protein